MFATCFFRSYSTFLAFVVQEGNEFQLEKTGPTNSSFNHSVIFFVFAFRESLVGRTH